MARTIARPISALCSRAFWPTSRSSSARKNDVLVLTSSGTGFMEASVSNLTSPGDRVLVLTAGKFAERWTALAKAFGCAVETVTAPYGETFSLEEVRRKLTPEIRCVYMQATESSTGARHDVEAIAKLVRALPDTLLVVDAITGLGTTRLDVDAWGIDVIIGGSQKALMIPPGLAYGAISERAWQRMETDEVSALLLRSAEGTKSGGQGRDSLLRPRPRSLPDWPQRSIMCVKWETGTSPRDAMR